ncbi:RNA-binding family protein [Hibiscus syriacus]|uniref:RNA-binding family protein n=2 Tax=Hibiscus syriacus TaxID=106335 RepID=A0A6A2XL78_HIBSY|nr:RNA-binding family protein [Hibiscus syriacus]
MTLISLLTINRSFHGTGAQETGKALIESTCKKTQYPEECISALESDPSSFNANLTGLTRIAVQKSESKLIETLNIVNKFVLNETDYLTWGFLVFCRDSYNASVPQIQAGLQAFDKLEFEKSYRSVEAVNKAVVECDKQGLKMISQVNSGLFRLTKDATSILDLLF